jgi:anthranilate phosphoribosyltransferase
VDARTRRMLGWALAVVGLIVALVGGLADQIGIGGDGPDEFGGKQVAALVGGLVVAAVGLVLAVWGQRERSSSVDAPGDPTAR